VRIRQQQLDMFQANDNAAFENKMVAHIASCYPEENAALVGKGGETAVRKLVRQTVERGRNYNITTEQAVGGLIDLTVVFGKDFEMTPDMSWTREILTDDSLTGRGKIEMIFQLLPQANS
jgi:hypothetical protein